MIYSILKIHGIQHVHWDELCDRQHPCSGTVYLMFALVFPAAPTRTALDFHAFLLNECEVEGIMCDDQNSCAGLLK